ncbi:type I-C CRISPR-associated endonuclease Cas1c [Kurthia massiliensis]|uniref:type I-C CRISPR-associated endonuclease Cas1c n=1 Tax=Kurthia massiliensis TaxID=1033739 RepID=UPI000287BDA4|nr:type I-C CRISPR-associated endonuclease Cas1c [Kurthia massiliensis]
MKKLLNTIYVTQDNVYLSLNGDNVVLLQDEQTLGRVPLHNIEGICTFGRQGASPALMHRCAKDQIALSFFNPNGRFLARVTGETHGNVVLRKTQYSISAEEGLSAQIAKNMIFAKVSNQKWIIERATRDHALRLNVDKFKKISSNLTLLMKEILEVSDLERLRGLEGQAARYYFSIFDELILQQKNDFFFLHRSRRPPLDYVNALLSFAYTLLVHDVQSALEGVGLDSYVGFLHRDRPGRASLALDMMEELRGVVADRFVLTLINKKIITSKDFIQKENGAVLLADDGRKKFLKEWQLSKMQGLTHPRLKEKINWGLVPHAQAQLLARHLRGDVEEYAPFLWK